MAKELDRRTVISLPLKALATAILRPPTPDLPHSDREVMTILDLYLQRFESDYHNKIVYLNSIAFKEALTSQTDPLDQKTLLQPYSEIDPKLTVSIPTIPDTGVQSIQSALQIMDPSERIKRVISATGIETNNKFTDMRYVAITNNFNLARARSAYLDTVSVEMINEHNAILKFLGQRYNAIEYFDEGYWRITGNIPKDVLKKWKLVNDAEQPYFLELAARQATYNSNVETELETQQAYALFHEICNPRYLRGNHCSTYVKDMLQYLGYSNKLPYVWQGKELNTYGMRDFLNAKGGSLGWVRPESDAHLMNLLSQGYFFVGLNFEPGHTWLVIPKASNNPTPQVSQATFNIAWQDILQGDYKRDPNLLWGRPIIS
jgi:hypothetical protein